MKNRAACLVAAGLWAAGWGAGAVHGASDTNRAPAADSEREAWLQEWSLGFGDAAGSDDTGLPETLDLSFEGLGGRTMIWCGPLWFTYYKVYQDNPSAAAVREWYDRAFEDFERMGVTDVAFNGGFTAPCGTMAGISGAEWELPPLCFPGWNMKGMRELGVEPLKEFAERCRRHRMKLWLVIRSLADHGCSNPEIVAARSHLYARDAKGTPYKVFAEGGLYDFFNEDTYRFVFSQMDWAKRNLEPYGVFQGYVYDEHEAWIYDWHEDDVDRFSAFCKQQFGEPAPATIAEKFALKGRWNDPNDLWWRRYVLWRMDTITTIRRRMQDHLHALGLQAFDYFEACVWNFAEDIRRLESCDAVRWCHRQAPYSDAIYMDNGFMLGHIFKAGLGRNHAMFPCGRPASLFAYDSQINFMRYKDQIASLAVRDKTIPMLLPRPEDEAAILFRNVRRWDGARSLCRAALLRYQTGNLLRNPSVRGLHAQDDPVVAGVAARQQARIIDIDLPRYFKNYDVLLAPPNGVRDMPPDRFAALMDYVRSGGVVISLNTEWTTARRDLTGDTNVTAEALGVAYAPGPVTPTELSMRYNAPGLAAVRLELGPTTGRRVARLRDGVEVLGDMLIGTEKAPAVTLNRIGKGAVLGLHVDVNPLLTDELRRGFDDVFVTFFDRLMASSGKAPLAWTRGQIQIGEAMQKGRDIGITFLGRMGLNETAHQGPWALPASGKAWVSAGILQPGASYTVTRRSRGIPERVLSPAGSETWSVQDLSEAGIPVTIDARRQFELLEIEAGR